MTSSSNRPRSSKSSSQRKKALQSAVQVKCKFCGNTFMAQPHLAVCVKCGRPANRKLDTGWIAAALLVPFIGFVNSFVIRPHSPLASTQSLYASIIGSFVYAAILCVMHSVLQIF